MASTQSTNMNLIIPNVGSEPGPTYAQDVNSSLTIIDMHDHSSGNGVQITPDGLNININLDFGGNFASNIAGLILAPQVSTPDVNTLYETGVDLYYVDGNGNNVRITQSGGVAGSPGSISNLTSPASASYVALSQTFVWQSDTSIAANMDFGSAILRNLAPNSTFGLTLSPPAALSSNYTLTLPSLPASQKIMTLDNSGNMSAPYVVDNTTIEISSNTIRVKDQGISTAKIADFAVTTAKLNDLAVTNGKIADTTIAIGKLVASSGAAGSASSATTSTSGTFATVCSVTATFIAGRTVLITLNGTTAAGSGRIGANTNGTSFGRFRLFDVTNSVIISTFYFDTTIGSTVIYYPASALNKNYVIGTAGSTQIALQYSASVNAGSTVAVDTVVISVVQV